MCNSRTSWKVTPATERMKSNRLVWFRHVMWREENRVTLIVTIGMWMDTWL